MSWELIGVFAALVLNFVTAGFGWYKWNRTQFVNRVEKLEKELDKCMQMCKRCAEEKEELRNQNIALMTKLVER